MNSSLCALDYEERNWVLNEDAETRRKKKEEKNNTQVKYIYRRYRILVLKYSSEVVLLCYYTSLLNAFHFYRPTEPRLIPSNILIKVITVVSRGSLSL